MSKRAAIGLVLASTGLVVLGSALLAGFVLHPPVLGWAGLVVVWVIFLGVLAVAEFVFPRMRINPRLPATSPDAEPRLLVVADEHSGSPALWRAIYARLGDAIAVHIVVPVRVSHLHYLTNDEVDESRAADDRARLAVELLRRSGVSVTGGLGSDDPLEAMTDALGTFPATRVLLATSTENDSYWMERRLLSQAQALTPLEVSHVVVPPTPAAEKRHEGRLAMTTDGTPAEPPK